MKRKRPGPIAALTIRPFPLRFRTVCQSTSFARKAIWLLTHCHTRPSSPAKRFRPAARNLLITNKKGRCHHENTIRQGRNRVRQRRVAPCPSIGSRRSEVGGRRSEASVLCPPFSVLCSPFTAAPIFRGPIHHHCLLCTCTTRPN